MMQLKAIALLILIIYPGWSKTREKNPLTDYSGINTVVGLKRALYSIAEEANPDTRNISLGLLWDTLRTRRQIPFTAGDSALFLFRGTATNVRWAGDFNRWSATAPGYEGTLVPGTDVWYLEKKFPSDARLDYKIVVDGNWIPDPANTFIQYSGFGPNSELRMPIWKYPEETIPTAGATRGTLSAPQSIDSKPENLNYSVGFMVYTPHNYTNLSGLPAIYVTDGHEYSDERLGSMITVLDNLIYRKMIEPVIAVFIDPRNPSNLSLNRRMSEYRANIKFADFVADELVTHIDSNYKTDSDPAKRAIMGTSLGGWNSAFFGLMRHDVFGLVAIHSPSSNQAIISGYAEAERLPLKIFMSTGLINDTGQQAQQLRDVFNGKGYPLLYKEVNEGHSWGNWRALIDDPLMWFFAEK
jgi:enterochelin esterase-like enzyme